MAAGFFILSKLYIKSKPDVEGEIIEGNFKDQDYDRIKIKTKDGEILTLNFDKQEYSLHIFSRDNLAKNQKNYNLNLHKALKSKQVFGKELVQKEIFVRY